MEGTLKRFGGVPSYFRARCLEASRGGTNSYVGAAWHLAIHLRGETPYGAESDEWDEEVEKLIELCAEEDREGIWQWLVERYPKCMALVPARRKDQFVTGVLQAYNDERI